MVYSKNTNITSIFIIQFRYNALSYLLKKHGLFQKGEHLIYFYNTLQMQRALWLDEKSWFILKRQTLDFFYNTVQIQRALWLDEKSWSMPKRWTFCLFLYYSSDKTRILIGWKGIFLVYYRNANIWSIFIIQFRYNVHSN